MNSFKNYFDIDSMFDHVYLSSQFDNRLKQVMRRPILESNQHKLGG